MGAKSKYSENFSASSVAEEMSSLRSGLQDNCQMQIYKRTGILSSKCVERSSR